MNLTPHIRTCRKGIIHRLKTIHHDGSTGGNDIESKLELKINQHG